MLFPLRERSLQIRRIVPNSGRSLLLNLVMDLLCDCSRIQIIVYGNAIAFRP
jgi:hypothetical protein